MMNSLNPRFGSMNQSPSGGLNQQPMPNSFSNNGMNPGNSAFGLSHNQRRLPNQGLSSQPPQPIQRPGFSGVNPFGMQSIAPSFGGGPSFGGNQQFLGPPTQNPAPQFLGPPVTPNPIRRLAPVIGALILALLIPLHASAQTLTSITFMGAFDHEEITVSSTATNFTASKINPSVSSTGLSGPQARAELATFICDDNSQAAPNNQIRILSDNGTPTTSVGQQLLPNTMVLFYAYANIMHAKFIRRGSNDVTCHAIYYRPSSVIP